MGDKIRIPCYHPHIEKSQPPPTARYHELVKGMEKYFARKLLEDDKSLMIRYMKLAYLEKHHTNNK